MTSLVVVAATLMVFPILYLCTLNIVSCSIAEAIVISFAITWKCYLTKTTPTGKPSEDHHLNSNLKKRKEANFSTNLSMCSLPQQLRMVVSNYEYLQRTFAVSADKCHHKLKPEEQFSPLVAILDAETGQQIGATVLLAGEKPPEVANRTLFCYISLNVTLIPYYGSLRSHPYSLHHLEKNTKIPCNPGEIALLFCFYQGSADYIIQFSIHSIADSQGIEYMYQCEECNYIVRVIDREKYSKCHHGAAMVKSHPFLKFTGPCASARFHKTEKLFLSLYLSEKSEQIHQVTKSIIESRHISVDIKVVALCYEALVNAALQKRFDSAEVTLRTALKMASQAECENSVMLQGRVFRYSATLCYLQERYDEGTEYALRAKGMLFNAAPSYDKASALHIDLLLRRRKLQCSTSQGTISKYSSQQYKQIEQDYNILINYADFLEEHEKSEFCSFLTAKARFHLRSRQITDEITLEECRPTSDDVQNAELCLTKVPLKDLPCEVNIFVAWYFLAFCDLHLWKQQYPEAKRYAEKAKELCFRGKITGRVLKIAIMRLKLLETLEVQKQGDEELDLIIDKFLGLQKEHTLP